MIQEVYQPKGLQEICNLLVPRVPQAACVRFQVSQDDRVPGLEAVLRLLQVRKVI